MVPIRTVMSTYVTNFDGDILNTHCYTWVPDTPTKLANAIVPPPPIVTATGQR